MKFSDITKMGGSEDRHYILQVPHQRTERADPVQHGREATKGRLHGKG